MATLTYKDIILTMEEIMSEEEIEEMMGHYLDNAQTAVEVCMAHVDNQELSEADRLKAVELLKERIRDVM